MRAKPPIVFIASTFLALLLLSAGAAHAKTNRPIPKKTWRIATKVFKPFSFKEGGDWVGFSIDLWDAVAKDLELDYEWVSTSSVDELLAAVGPDGDCDAAIAGISLTPKREEFVDFSFPYYQSGLQVLVSTRDRSGNFFLGTLLPTLLRVGGVGLVILLCVAHLVWLAERRANPEHFPPEYRKGIWDAFWWTAVTLTTVGYGDRIPLSRTGRALALVWMFSGIVLVSYFTASVTTGLTVERLSGAIGGPDDLGGHDVATVDGSTAARWLAQSRARTVPVPKLHDATQALLEGRVDAVVYDAPALRYFAMREGQGRVEVVGPVFQQQGYGIALREGSPLFEPVNLSLLRVRENGTQKELSERWFGK